MEKRTLGKSGLEVSRLCFGSLTMTAFQADLSIDQGAKLINYAFEKGINFLDTAEIYDNYAYLKEAFKSIRREDYIISTKTYAYSEELAKESLDKALKEIGTDYIDIFLLHEQESVHTIRGHYEALQYLIKAKKEGKIRALGLSTHNIAAVRAAKEFDEIEIIHPIVNKLGLGINDGSIEEMVEELRQLSRLDKGIYGMKALGGGHLISNLEEALTFCLELDFLDSIAVGMQSTDEIDANIQLFDKGSVDPSIKDRLGKKERRLIVADYCTACGNCQVRCQQDGIEIVNGQAVANDKCILCGYCATVCPEFCIKVI